MAGKNPQAASYSLAEIKEALKDAQPSDVFCKVWPQAKQALEALLEQINENPALERCVKGVIAAGDTYYGQTCGQ